MSPTVSARHEPDVEQPVSTPLNTAAHDRLEQLRRALSGRNAPVHVQLLWQLLHALPQPVAARPGSAQWRSEVRALLIASPAYVELTRSETASAVAFLARRALLPTWVRCDAAFEEAGRGDRG